MFSPQNLSSETDHDSYYSILFYDYFIYLIPMINSLLAGTKYEIARLLPIQSSQQCQSSPAQLAQHSRVILVTASACMGCDHRRHTGEHDGCNIVGVALQQSSPVPQESCNNIISLYTATVQRPLNHKIFVAYQKKLLFLETSQFSGVGSSKTVQYIASTVQYQNCARSAPENVGHAHFGSKTTPIYQSHQRSAGYCACVSWLYMQSAAGLAKVGRAPSLESLPSKFLICLAFYRGALAPGAPVVPTYTPLVLELVSRGQPLTPRGQKEESLVKCYTSSCRAGVRGWLRETILEQAQA